MTERTTAPERAGKNEGLNNLYKGNTEANKQLEEIVVHTFRIRFGC
jgi:hypothetical protein